MSAIQKWRLAIIAFWDAFYQVLGLRFDKEQGERSAQRDSELLATSDGEGLRYGGPGWPNLKLHYERDKDTFYLESNGMDEETFLRFQGIVAEKFKDSNLSLRLMSS
jgi:hypothetical protein